MLFKSTIPPYPLSLFVKQYWAIENNLPAGSEHIQRVIPTGLMELSFYLGKKPESLDKNRSFDDNIVLNGQHTGFYDLLITENLSMFSIQFQPYGAKMIFNIPSVEFVEQTVSLRYILKDKISDLEAKLYDAREFDDKVILVNEFIMEQLSKNQKEYELKRILNTVASITDTKGLITIDKLASGACVGRKQFERIFSDYIGISPKQFLRIVRFQSSLYYKQKNKDISLTEMAYASGYSDQSHMINNYKALAGITPTQFFAECEPTADYFL